MEQIEDTAELAQVRRQARRIPIKAGLAALLLTIVALALPRASLSKHTRTFQLL